MSKLPENNKNKEGEKSFRFPDNYFQSSASALKNKIEWLDEHKQFPLLASFQKENVFGTPANYFNTAEAGSELLAFPELKRIEKNIPFIIPENYFTIAAKKLEEKLQYLDEIRDYKFLGRIEKQNPFKPGKTYFEDNASTLQNRINNTETKIIRLHGKRSLYFSAAAIMVLCLGIWLYDFYSRTVNNADCGTLACIDKKELLQTKAIENLDRDELYELVDAKKLEENLDAKDQNEKNKKSTDSLIDSDELLDEL